MITLSYVPEEQFARLQALACGPAERARIFAALCRINTLYMIARAGSGHIGTSFSSLDIVCWLHLNELRDPGGEGPGPRDVYFSSKGHDAPALYSILIASGRLGWDKLHVLRRLGGLPGHPDISTPGIKANTGSLGMGISKAKGMVAANRLLGREARVYVLLGDGELQEGQFWESLASAANQAMGEIVAIVDYNKIQSDTWVARVIDLGDLEAKLAAFGWHVQRCDGHDPEALAAALARAKAETAHPSIIVADTVKGRGVSFMEWGEDQKDEPLYPYHSGAPDPETYQRAFAELTMEARRLLAAAGEDELMLETLEHSPVPPPQDPERLVPAYGRALVEQGRRNPRLVSLDADLILDTGQIPFRDAFGDRVIECGIAEQDMVSQAGGLALEGFLPVVHSFACFLSTRPNEQIYNNASEGKKIIYVGSLAGVLPGGPGHSHQAVRDIAALSGIPGLTLIEPCCEAEVEMVLDYAVNAATGSTYIRLVSIPCKVPYRLPDGYLPSPGRGTVLREGVDGIVFAYGPVMLSQAWHAAEHLARERGLSIEVVNLPWLNRIDRDWLIDVTSGIPCIFTLDNHYLEGGVGERLACALAECQLNGSVVRFGLAEIPVCGTNDEVLRHHGLDAEGLASRIADTCSSSGTGSSPAAAR